MLVKPPEHLGRIDSVVEQVSGDQSIRLLPESDFSRASFVPAVADDAVFVGHLSGEHGGLDRACDCRDGWSPYSRRAELTDPGRVVEQLTREPYDINDANALQGSIPASSWLNESIAESLGEARMSCLSVLRAFSF